MAEWIVELGDGNIHIKKMSPLVRCRDCKHFVVYYDGVTDCRFIEEKAFAESPLNNLPDDFCSRGERKEVEE